MTWLTVVAKQRLSHRYRVNEIMDKASAGIQQSDFQEIGTLGRHFYSPSPLFCGEPG